MSDKDLQWQLFKCRRNYRRFGRRGDPPAQGFQEMTGSGRGLFH
jgi:hypothetical protein